MKGKVIYMNHMYAEAAVKCKDTPKSMALRVLMILGMIIGVLILLLGSFFSIIGAIIIVLLGYLFPKLNIEYEYVFVDGQLDFDKISGKSSRKTMLRIDMDQIEIVAPSKSHALDSFNNMQLILKNFTSNDAQNKTYTIISNTNSKKLKILFEPTEEMIDLMRQKSPRKVSLY